jgi:hypothetical protein
MTEGKRALQSRSNKKILVVVAEEQQSILKNQRVE